MLNRPGHCSKGVPPSRAHSKGHLLEDNISAGCYDLHREAEKRNQFSFLFIFFNT